MALGTLQDRDIQNDVMEELDWDPEVAVTDVGVEVDEGIVTLTGTVDTFTKKFAAEQAAFRVEGVRAIANDIVVQPDGVGYRTDTEIASAAATALELVGDVPADQIHIRVSGGRVTLHGDVAWNFQRASAEEIVRKLRGVTAVTNLIGVAEQPTSAADIKADIERAFVRHAELDADAIMVAVDHGHVTLSGRADTWKKRREAELTAWKARGVTRVTDMIRITPA